MISDRRAFLTQLAFGLGSLGFISSFPSAQAALFGSGRLPRSFPEARGVRSEGILSFLNALEGSPHEFHSFMMMRHGQVIAEGWWSPYRSDLKHMLYSLSKSFTSTAVGWAKSEGKLTIYDPVISFFPDKLPTKVSENLRALKIKDLLTMSVGHAQDSTPAITKEEDWVKAFLALPIPNQPGTRFLYNSGATYMLSAIVQKMTGQKVIDFLKLRLFKPLAIQGMTWETCPLGINTGGWGLSLRTEDLAKFGQLYLQRGFWDSRQLLPADWIEEATIFKIQQPGDNLEKLKQESDWHQGYCYQFWRCRHNAFRGDGAFGQYTIVMPDQDVVIAITSESPSMQGEMNLIWDHLLPAIQQEPIAPNKSVADELQNKLCGLRLQAPQGKTSSPTATRVSGRPFKVVSNEAGVQEVTFRFGPRDCVFTLRDSKATYPITCGLETYIKGETMMPGTPPKLTKSHGASNSKIAAWGTWTDERTFQMTWRFIETPHHDTVTCLFEGNQVRVEFMNSITRLSALHKENRPALVGQLAS